MLEEKCISYSGAHQASSQAPGRLFSLAHVPAFIGKLEVNQRPGSQLPTPYKCAHMHTGALTHIYNVRTYIHTYTHNQDQMRSTNSIYLRPLLPTLTSHGLDAGSSEVCGKPTKSQEGLKDRDEGQGGPLGTGG